MSKHVFENANRCATVQPQSEPTEDHRIVFGLSWGRTYDEAHCIAVIDATSEQLVAMYRWKIEGFSGARDRILELNAIWKPRVIYGEASGIGSPNIEALQSHGLPVDPVVTSVGELNRMLMYLDRAVMSGDIKLIPDNTLLAQLETYEIWENPHTGVLRYKSMDQHECVIALALAWSGVERTRLNIHFNR